MSKRQYLLKKEDELVKRFKTILFHKLNNIWKKKKHLIPIINEDLKILKNKNYNYFRTKKILNDVLIKRMEWNERNSKDFMKEVCKLPARKKTKSPKEKFKYVTGSRNPVQGGSPGLGKKK
tara:strand:- start:305 stop:667 length:363 start_codon:yes stop_codon:yes gene_type:complete